MTEKFVTALSRQMHRRAFLRRVASGAAGVLLGLLGIASQAAAVGYKCCSLCFSPAGSCTGNCTDNRIWCWACTYIPENRDYLCCEHFLPGYTCQGENCIGVDYSCAKLLGTAPAP